MTETLGAAELVLDISRFFVVKAGTAISFRTEWAGV
jgi:hypothetical protein